MSQHDLTIDNASGSAVRADLNNALQALGSTSIGSSAPSTLQTGQLWIDNSGTPWVLKVYDGAQHISVGTINASTNVFGLPDDTITTASVADNAITNALMADDAIGVAELSATGTASSSTYLRGDNSWAAVSAGLSAASQAEMEAGSSNTVSVTPGRIKFSAMVPKVVCRFEANGTVGGESVGVSSITDSGTGDFTVNLSTAFSSTNYIAIGSAHDSASENIVFDARATGTVDCNCFNAAGSASDPSNAYITLWGDQA